VSAPAHWLWPNWFSWKFSSSSSSTNERRTNETAVNRFQYGHDCVVGRQAVDPEIVNENHLKQDRVELKHDYYGCSAAHTRMMTWRDVRRCTTMSSAPSRYSTAMIRTSDESSLSVWRVGFALHCACSKSVLKQFNETSMNVTTIWYNVQHRRWSK